MSMNLCFLTKAKRQRLVDFPFQTPTEWTYEIYEAPPAKRETILRSKMKDNPWLEESLVVECLDMMNDPDLELSYI